MSYNSTSKLPKIREITDVFTMDGGAPMPVVLSSDNQLFVVFFDNSDDQVSYIVTFDHYYQYIFGGPNDETLDGHRYYDLGLESYGLFEVENSEWLRELKKIDSVHPDHDERGWEKTKHFIITFHDSMLECAAESFTVEKSTEKRTEIVERIAKQLI